VQYWNESQREVLLPNVSSILKAVAESDDGVPGSGIGAKAEPMQGARKQTRFLCFCVDALALCKFDHSFLLHLKSKCPISFSMTLIWMHSTYFSNFWIQWRTVRGSNFGNFGMLLTLIWHNPLWTYPSLTHSEWWWVSWLTLFFILKKINLPERSQTPTWRPLVFWLTINF
jgi:hypothetical protein